MEGLRTYLVALILAVVGIVNEFAPGALPWDEATANSIVTTLAVVVYPVAMIVMRKLTKEPPAL